jgi:hypothetical protein
MGKRMNNAIPKNTGEQKKKDLLKYHFTTL